MADFKTEQEKFWSGGFGDEYSERNVGREYEVRNAALFAKAFSHVSGASSLVEFGANIGLNMAALHRLFPGMALSAVEINSKAARQLRKLPYIEQVYEQSILDFAPNRRWDMTLAKGVPIHIAPEEIANVYEKLYRYSGKYICLAEYYNPTPTEANYRGHAGKLFKRDFAGDLLDRYPDLGLLDYGFVYRRDNHFPQDDLTWFVLEKKP
jgi:spore coat polysaccharide biosynthesis protein SpsF